MSRTHRANRVLESVPGYDVTPLNSMCLKLSSVHFLSPKTFSSFLSIFISANGTTICIGTQARIHSHPQLLLFLHAFHLISHQFLSIPSLRHSLNLSSSLSGSALVQALIISLLGNVTTSVLLPLQFILHVIVPSLNYRFDFVTHYIKSSKYFSLSAVHSPQFDPCLPFQLLLPPHLSLFPSYTE